MANNEPRDRVVRVLLSDDQWRALRVLAVERDMELRALVTTALQTSPLTKRALADA